MPSPLRTSMHCAYANGALWGLGSGLASMTLVLYYARELGASGTAIAWLLAAPSLVGLLRLFTPWWLERVGSRRRFCVAMFLASSAAVAALPVLGRPGWLPDAQWSVVALGVTWAAYQVLEYIGVVALWSWYGDLVPGRIRGRFVGRREAWMTTGLVAGSLAAAGAAWGWQQVIADKGQPDLLWRSYAACASFGAAFLALATLPLVRMTDVPHELPSDRARRTRLRDLVQPLVDPHFRRFMLFGVWFSMANGLVQSPRQMFIASVLRIELAEKRVLDGVSRGAQIALMPWIGDVVDRRGNVPVLIRSWAIVSAAFVFFLLAKPETKWWIAAVYLCWVAYAGVNVALPNLMLKLSPPERRATYAAAWFAWPQLTYAISIILGGWLLDVLKEHDDALSFYSGRFDRFTVLFILGGLLALIGIPLAARIQEPQVPKGEPRASSPRE